MTIEIKQGEDKIEDIIKALLARARRLFPDLEIHGELVSMESMLVYRIHHEKALSSGETWIVIVGLTTLWESKSDHRWVVVIEDMVRTIKQYDTVVYQISSLGLVQPREIAIEATWVIKTE